MIATSRPTLVDALQTRLLQAPLPGMDAQLKMAHAVRRADPRPDLHTTRYAAVLITLFEKSPDDWHVIFIRRTTIHEKDKHGGQVGFPGGKREEPDPDLMFTALREAEEEIALDLSGIDVLGPLTPLYITVSKYLVHPYVAYSWKTPVLVRQESEVEEILELPLSCFFDPSCLEQTRIHLTPGIVLNHVPAYRINNHVVWGATAMIMSELIDIIHPEWG